MFWLFVQYLWYLLAALALGVLVGWLWWGRRLKRSTTVTQDVRRDLLAERNRAEALSAEHETTKRQLVEVSDRAAATPDHSIRVRELEAALAGVTARADSAGDELAAAKAAAQDHATKLSAAQAEHASQLAELRNDHTAQLAAARAAATQAATEDHAAQLTDLRAQLATAQTATENRATQLASLRAEHDQLATAHAELEGRPAFLLPPIGERVPADGRQDDLERVEGIGPKMGAALRAAGITTFAQLSNATEAELHTAVEAAGLPFAPSIPTWAKQAALLARGDDEGFAAYTGWLVAGVPPTDGSPDPVRTRFRAADRLMALASASSSAPSTAPAPLRLTTDTGADDLTIVEGIGPKMATALHDAGIHTFASLAAASEDALRAAVQAAGLSFAPSIPTWARQAQFLANGDRAGFQAYADHLVAGRDPGADR